MSERQVARVQAEIRFLLRWMSKETDQSVLEICRDRLSRLNALICFELQKQCA